MIITYVSKQRANGSFTADTQHFSDVALAFSFLKGWKPDTARIIFTDDKLRHQLKAISHNSGYDCSEEKIWITSSANSVPRRLHDPFGSSTEQQIMAIIGGIFGANNSDLMVLFGQIIGMNFGANTAIALSSIVGSSAGFVALTVYKLMMLKVHHQAKRVWMFTFTPKTAAIPAPVLPCQVKFLPSP